MSPFVGKMLQSGESPPCRARVSLRTLRLGGSRQAADRWQQRPTSSQGAAPGRAGHQGWDGRGSFPWPLGWPGRPGEGVLGVSMVSGAIKAGSSMHLGGLAWELKLDPWAGRDTPWFSPYDTWGVSHGAK